MSEAPPNELTASAAEVKPRHAEKPRLRIVEAFTWIFENPKWLMQTAIGAVVLNFPLFPLPILAQIVALGYLFGCLEDELRKPRFGYADFDMNRLSEYLMRGAFPWLVNFVMTLVGIPFALMVFFPTMMAGVGMVNTRDELWMFLGFVVMGLGYMVYIALILIVSVAPVPLMLRVGITKNFKDAFELRWALSFFRKVWWELLVSGFVLYLAMVPLILIGVLACVVGVWFVVAWLYFVGFRLLLQLYEIFLSRGGEPIPLPPLAVKAPASPGVEISSPFAPAPG
jgi:hypothetical protein